MRAVKVYAIALSAGIVGWMPVAFMQGPDEAAAKTIQATRATDAAAGFDNVTNGHTTQAVFDTNRATFEEVEGIADGLGPVFNQTSCVACHGNPVTGGISQVSELRAGHFNGSVFVDPPGGSLINDNSIRAALQETVPDGNEVRTFRTSLNILGDGYVEAILNGTFTDIRGDQPPAFQGTIITVPVVEAGGTRRVARFGWKNQHASLLSFAGDAYLNEMGITNLVNGFRNFATENTSLGRSVADADKVADPEDNGEDVTAFAEFMRSTKAPARGAINSSVNAGAAVFEQATCVHCHTPSITTAPPGTMINGGQLAVSPALGNKTIHPFGDYMLHDLGTGDGIVQNGGPATRNMVRTAPLWGVRTRGRLMHDGQSLTLAEAILRHSGTGGSIAANRFRNLNDNQKANLIAFLKSL
jgi:CxxC motif-containing protein (DUF1111 family)